MTKSQIEKFAVGYSSYPTDCVEEVLKVTNFDEDVARKILDDKEKTLAIWQNGTIMIDGVTLCCGYDFAEDAFSKRINIGYCPICGRKIVIKKPMKEWFAWKIRRGNINETVWKITNRYATEFINRWNIWVFIALKDEYVAYCNQNDKRVDDIYSLASFLDTEYKEVQ